MLVISENDKSRDWGIQGCTIPAHTVFNYCNILGKTRCLIDLLVICVFYYLYFNRLSKQFCVLAHQALDGALEQLDISSYGVIDTDLEEVFLKVTDKAINEQETESKMPAQFFFVPRKIHNFSMRSDITCE